jgi:hypothetical protein
MLSSDILEQQFGQTELNIIKQTPEYRIIQTVAKKDSAVLELSFVTFDRTDAFPIVHAQVLKGSSMGKAYHASGIEFERDIKSVSKLPVPISLQNYFQQKGLSTIVEVSILVGQDHVHYCDIIEIYHPSVKWPQEVTTHNSNIQSRLELVSKLL